jgi:DNA-binding transcriptional ArsR family regulator
MGGRDHRGRTGSHSARPSRTRRGSITEQFVPMVLSLLESDALATLSLAARRCLDRFLIEHMQHAGKENGRLKVTYEDFATFGVRRASIAAALRELEERGLIEVVERGRGGNREYRKATVFRITFLPTSEAEPTDGWRKFDPHPPRDIDSRRENEPGPVGAKTRPKTA